MPLKQGGQLMRMWSTALSRKARWLFIGGLVQWTVRSGDMVLGECAWMVGRLARPQGAGGLRARSAIRSARRDAARAGRTLFRDGCELIGTVLALPLGVHLNRGQTRIRSSNSSRVGLILF